MATIEIKFSELAHWHKIHLNTAWHISLRSKDPSTKCGAIITKGKYEVSLGYNGFSTRVKDLPERYTDRDLKYQLMLHAETNAILKSKKSLNHTTIYTYPLPPCVRCACNIIQAGITKVIAPKPLGSLALRWKDSLNLASTLYNESDVQLILVTDIPEWPEPCID